MSRLEALEAVAAASRRTLAADTGDEIMDACDALEAALRQLDEPDAGGPPLNADEVTTAQALGVIP